MQLAELMATDVLAVSPDTSVADAARRMVERETGVAVVRDGERLAGIISERDMLRLLSEGGDPATPVRHRMTTNVLTGSPSTPVAEALAIMVQGRFRHLPITDGDRVVGIISMRDLMAWTALRLRQGAFAEDELDTSELVANIHQMRTGAN